MKGIIIFMCIVITIKTVSAQYSDNDPIVQLKSNETEILGEISYRFLYEQTETPDILAPDEKNRYAMYLEVSDESSKYVDQRRVMVDSIRYEHAQQKIHPDKTSSLTIPLLRNSNKEIIHKNYPKGKITTINRIPFNFYIFDEEFITPEWKLIAGDTTVCGYRCRKASTKFRGRNFTAWYAPDIPISDGPWKFAGLPGLIMKISDKKNHYSFVCIGIEKFNKPTNLYISISPNMIKVTKQQFYQKQKIYMGNPGAHISNTGQLFTELPQSAYRSKPYNPIELSE